MTDLNVIDAEFTEVTAEPFDYVSLDTDTAEQLQEIAQQDMKATAMFWIARAERLTKANELLSKNGYGCFGEWVEKEIGIGRTAAFYLVKAYGEYEKMIVHNVNNQNIDFLPQSFFRKLATNDSQAEQIKEDVLAGKIKDSKEYKAALAKAKKAEDDKDSAEKTIQNLKSVLADTRKQLSEANEKAKGADKDYLAKLEDDVKKANKRADRANLAFEELQDKIEELDKRGGDLMRERDKYAQMAEEIAGELKQAQELNARLLAEGKQPDAESDIVIVLATAARQINDGNLEACVKHILSLDDGETIFNRFKSMLYIKAAMRK